MAWQRVCDHEEACGCYCQWYADGRAQALAASRPSARMKLCCEAAALDRLDHDGNLEDQLAMRALQTGY